MSTSPTTSSPTSAREAKRLQLEAGGLNPAEVEHILEVLFSRARTIATAVDAALPELKRDKPGTYKTYAPYLRLLVDGLPELCACTCIACSSSACTCTTSPNGHADACQPSGATDPVDCSERFAGCGDEPVTEVKKSDISDAGWWCERRGLKRNAARAVQGRVQPTHDGRGSRETLINASRWLIEWLIDDNQEPGLTNVAKRVTIPPRQETVARSLDADEFVDTYQVAVATGRDPVLDGILLRHLIVQAVRRGGAVDATAGGIDVTANALSYWDQKRKQWRQRPTTRTHLQDLVAHAVARGPRVAAGPHAPAKVRHSGVPAIGNDDPLFYRQPLDEFDADGNFVRRTVQPVSKSTSRACSPASAATASGPTTSATTPRHPPHVLAAHLQVRRPATRPPPPRARLRQHH